MTKETDRPPSGEITPSSSAPPSAAPANARRKPRFAIFVATAAGLGYLPKAPGTWGSLAGVGLTLLISTTWMHLWNWTLSHFLNFRGDVGQPLMFFGSFIVDSRMLPLTFAAIFVAVIGVWASSSTAKFSGLQDPQFVVIDEVSGQMLTFVVALAPLNWKYLLLGFILFRVFDIWKPFPARQAESLHGGWGIMADDWIAAIYAGLGLWLARAFGL
jgi:phosphatidylglycerophosphatase A